VTDQVESDGADAAAIAERVRVLSSHVPRLRAVAVRALDASSRDDAEDMVAELMADVWHGRLTRLPDPERQLLAFAEGVLRNRAMHLNRRRRRTVSLDDAPVGGDSIDHWAAADRIITAHDVGEALHRLTPRQRELASLHWIQQQGCPLIAAELGISLRTVKELLRRARKALCADLHRYNPMGPRVQ
jgi:RNA polymerase sigma-70 factor, ECF subfamily